MARDAFVANSGSGTVSVIDTGTNSVVANVGVGKEPVDVAIAPDGSRAYVVNKGSNTVSVISVATLSVVDNIVVGKEPAGVAIAPNGQYALVGNFGDGTVSAIGIATGSVVANVAVGKEPEGIAIAPDSRFAYVAQRSGGISVIDSNGFATVGAIDDSVPYSRLAFVPRGGRAFATDPESASVSAFNPATRDLVGPPIGVDTGPAGIAIAPNGSIAFVASPAGGSITPFDTSLDAPLSGPLGGFPGATGVAIEPNGLQGYVTDGAGSSVTVLDTTRNAAVGSIGVGAKPTAVAVVPDQGPRASFWISPDRKRAKAKLTFHAGASVDPDGQIVNYAWSFGDGGHAEGTTVNRVHRYRRRGEYTATLTVTDGEGCSTEQVYTGQTVSCNGSPAASYAVPIVVVNNRGPVLKLRAAARQSIAARVNVFARCPREACGVRARGVLVTVVERGGGKLRRSLRLPAARSLRPTRGSHRLRLKLSAAGRRAARRALRQGGEAKLIASVTATDPTGQVTLQRRQVKLVRPH
jgi:YVTN family beta-propeller protein